MRAHHGIALGLFSLTTKNSCGIGEFLDLIPLISWCEKVGFNTLQLLPINDSNHDNSPYNAISSCALNPIYLSLKSLPYLGELSKKLKLFSPFNQTEKVEYSEVRTAKMAFLKTYFENTKDNFAKDSHFEAFKKNQAWLIPYALFTTIHALLNTSVSTWGPEYELITPDKLFTLTTRFQEDIDFQSLLQYLCYLQMVQVKSHADQKNIKLFGDMPILVSPDSADVWEKKELFDLSLMAGAPPDTYNQAGQCWGFPLYNWKKIEEDHFAYIKQRLTYASHFYHFYRLDHVVGFFRIYVIPHGKSPKEGFFVPHDENLWLAQGQKILTRLLALTPMIPIAEDLGTVPSMVRPCLLELGIPGTKVMRWERNWDSDKSFIDPSQYPSLSLTTISTHDSDTLAQWWRDFPDEAGIYAKEKNWDYPSCFSQQMRQAILTESHHSASCFHINLLQEYLALQDSLVHPTIDQERINMPGIINETNWTYRFKTPLETIIRSETLQKAIQVILHA